MFSDSRQVKPHYKETHPGFDYKAEFGARTSPIGHVCLDCFIYYYIEERVPNYESHRKVLKGMA